jgi:hypothetical protein
MKKTHKATMTAAALLVTMLLVTLGVSCQRQGTGGTAQAPKTVDYSEHETFTAWLYSTTDEFYSDYSDNPIVRYLGNKYNVTLQFQQPVSGTETDSLSLMFGTGEYTDMIEMSRYAGSVSDLYNDGVIINIADYLDYMPNFKGHIDKDVNFRRQCYDDDGRILTLRNIQTEVELMWGGLVYRRDILETMTGGNIKFPSGNEHPTTIEDCDYMLPFYKSYFEAAGMKEYAPMILPSNGYFYSGEFLSGFGAAGLYYLEEDKVKYGFLEEGFYNYLKKMHEWYAAGYIYKDFSSRVNDPFYLPNTSLTYGGAAGVWFGMQAQLGDAMSMPQYNLYFDVQPMPSPIDTAHGITEAPNILRPYYYDDTLIGWAVTSKCKNIPKLLSVLDYMYSHEGGMLKVNGLTREQGADTDPVYVKAGMTDGSYWFEDGKLVFNPLLAYGGGTLDYDSFCDMRLPGQLDRTIYRQAVAPKLQAADLQWAKYQDTKMKKLSSALSYSSDDEKKLRSNNVAMSDYVTSTLPKFIMGTQPLNDQAWAEFKATLRNLGAEENIRIQQAAYERWLKR